MYEILASPVFEVEAKRMVTSQFRYHPTEWKKFSDGTDHIRLGGFSFGLLPNIIRCILPCLEKYIERNPFQNRNPSSVS